MRTANKYHQLTKQRYDLARAMAEGGLATPVIATTLGLTPRNTKTALEHTWEQIEEARTKHREKYKPGPKAELQFQPTFIVDKDFVDDDAATPVSEFVREEAIKRAEAADRAFIEKFNLATKDDIKELQDFIVKHFKGKKARWIS